MVSGINIRDTQSQGISGCVSRLVREANPPNCHARPLQEVPPRPISQGELHLAGPLQDDSALPDLCQEMVLRLATQNQGGRAPDLIWWPHSPCHLLTNDKADDWVTGRLLTW